MTTLYCIRCESMELAQNGYPAEFVHESFIWDGEYDVCEFPYGWAVCPPPEFDMDQFMESVEEPGTDDLDSLVLESVF